MPLCESRCEGNPQHERECAFLRENRRQDDEEPTTADADLITLMRAALLRTGDPGVYGRVLALESNRGSKVFVKNESSICRKARVTSSTQNFR